MNYRIYANINGWKLLDITNYKEMLILVKELITNDENIYLLVIEHNKESDTDNTLFTYRGNVEKYYNFVEEQKIRKL